MNKECSVSEAGDAFNLMRTTSFTIQNLLIISSFFFMSFCHQVAESIELPRAKAHPQTITMSSIGWSPAMREYHKLVIRRVLDLSVDRYGAYSLDFATKSASVQRVRNEIAFGDHYQVDFSAMILDDPTVRSKTHQIRFPIFNQTLGLRQLIVSKNKASHFHSVNTLKDFTSLRAGQGENWQDIGIYEDAGINVVESINYENLFPMLVQQRFDYLPLGIIEAGIALQNEKDFVEHLNIVDDVYIYYPIPFYINVTKRFTGLVERIDYGVEKFKASGEMRAMFNSYFKQQLASLNPDKSLVFVMKNPELTLEENQRITKNVLESYFTEKSNLYFLPSRRFNGDVSNAGDALILTDK